MLAAALVLPLSDYPVHHRGLALDCRLRPAVARHMPDPLRRCTIFRDTTIPRSHHPPVKTHRWALHRRAPLLVVFLSVAQGRELMLSQESAELVAL
jgi:hypothetical protein